MKRATRTDAGPQALWRAAPSDARAPPMTEVIFLTSVQAEQDRRVQSISEKVRQRIPGIDVKVLSGASNRDLMAKHKIQFGPAVIVDGRLEYVGIPRLSMLVDRILQMREGRPSPRTAGDKPGAAPTAKPPAAPAGSNPDSG